MITQDEQASETDYFREIPNYVPGTCYECTQYNNQVQKVISWQNIMTCQLVRIESNGTLVYFDKSSSGRLDLPGDKSIDYIRVVSKSTNTPVKKYHLNYGYFIGNGMGRYTPSQPNMQDVYNKRLKLLNLEELSVDIANSNIIRHEFYYDETIMPPRNSYAQDHWGYYNGANSNQTMLPKTSNLPASINWGNRNANSDYARAGILNKIVYPTGGSTNFDFEANGANVQEGVRTDLYKEITMSTGTGGATSTQSLTISEAQWCHIRYQVTLGNYPQESIDASLEIIDQNNVVIKRLSGAANIVDYPLYIDPGQYTMKMTYPDIPQSNLFSRVDYKSAPVSQNFFREVGGLRLKQMTDKNTIDSKDVIRKYIYTSGIVTGPSNNDDYLSNHIERAYRTCEPPDGASGTPVEQEYKCQYSGRSSFSKYSLGSISGGHIAYPNVKVVYGLNGENGFTENTFAFEYPVTGGGFPYPHAMVYEDRNGLPLIQKEYNSSNELLKQTTNIYDYDEKYRELSMKVGFLYDDPLSDAYGNGRYHDVITTTYYNILSENAKKKSTVVTQFDPVNSSQISNEQKYYYEGINHFQPTRIETSNSKNETISEIVKYARDYTAATSGFISNLKLANYNAPIEKYSIKKLANGQEYIIAGSITTFKENQLLPDKIYILDCTSPILKSQFTASSVNGNGLLLMDARYSERVSFNLYSFGKLLEQSKTNDSRSVYIWGYGHQYPVAEIVGSDYATVSSFINQTVLDNPASTDHQIRDELNKIRLGLANSKALVTTYTCKPLIGITSQTDPNAKTTYYEYDSFGRLKYIKDDKLNVIKVMDYQYKKGIGE